MNDVEPEPELKAATDQLVAAIELLRAEHPECLVTEGKCEILQRGRRKRHRYLKFELVCLDDDGGPGESLVREALKRVGLDGHDTEYGVDDEGREVFAVTGDVDLD